MAKRILLLMLCLALVLAACAKNEPAGGGAVNSSPQAPKSTSVQSPIQATQAPQENQVASPAGCTAVSRQVPNETQQSVLPPPTEKDWARGPSDAYVTMIEYSDFQCPYCAVFTSVLTQLEKAFPDDVRVVYRHFPLVNIHDKSTVAAQAAEAAGLQGKFWEMHDFLFTQRDQWVDLPVEEFPTWVISQSVSLGLDAGQFSTDLTSEALVNLSKEAWDKNSALGMPGTPFLVVNGYPYQGNLDYASMETVVKLRLLEKRQFTECPAMTIDPAKKYMAILHTAKGDITIELYANKTPLAVNNFVFLARQGWYDGVIFHRVLPGFVAQAGDPTGTGYGGPGYAFENEVVPGLNFDGPGVVGMANAGPGSNGSQFFITYAAAENLNGGYTVFGRVIAGMDVVESLTLRDPSKPVELPPGDVILSVTIEEK